MFIPLRLHSVYSRGLGGLTLQEAAGWLAGKRLPAAALADVGNLYGWAGWKRAAGAAGLKPLFGCELEVEGLRVVFLVKDREGYWNLMETFNTRRVRSGRGLIGILVPEPAGGPGLRAAGPGGNGSGRERSAGAGPRRGLERAAAELASCFEPGDLYLGVDFSNFKTALGLRDRASPAYSPAAASLPPVWAGPLKYVSSPERLILLRAISNKTPYPVERDRLSPKLALFGPEQGSLAVRRFGAPASEALKRTFEAAEKCSFPFAGIVPGLPDDIFPRGLRRVVMEKLGAMKNLDRAARERALRELEAVERSGFGPYFLLVHDIVAFARGRGIMHNLRGSGASSFLAYLLGIAAVNPLEFDLYFERFLNPGRPEPPDIDLDFDSRRRDEVLAYVLETYGSGRTGAAFVCSLKDFRARSALYETLRAFGMPPEEARGHAKRVPFFAEPAGLRRGTPAAGCLEAWKLASELQGVFHEVSLHVGGVILTPGPRERFLPLERSAKGLCMTHYDRDAVEDLKLIKLDLLSVRGLAAVSETRQRLRLEAIPAGDRRVYAALGAGRTIGCFQVESPAMRNLLGRMKPADIHELTQALALVRPGPTESGMKELLLAGRDGGRPRRGRPAEPDACLRRVLPETGGILLYEEQVMQVAERAAGLPPEEGDLLRRALKKRGAGAAPLREKFFRGARARGYADEDIERLWRTMEKFSSYSFNKAHSASYAHVAYQAVYLRVHHPVEYFAAVLNAGGGYYGLPEYVAEARRGGIRILAPDVNRSLEGFEVEPAAGGKAIRVGFSSIKGLTRRTIDRIVEERRDGPYDSVEDFLARVKPARADLLALIKAGALDALEPRRARQVLRYFQGLERMDAVADISDREKKKQVYEALGFLPGGDELELFEGRRPELRIRDLGRCAGTLVELVVRVVDIRPVGGYSRFFEPGGGRPGREAPGNGARYFYLFEDETGLVEGVGEARCVTYGEPPVCFLRGEVRRDGTGAPRVVNCSFLRAF